MKNNTTKIITFIGTMALSLSALFVSVASASGGNPFGANPGFSELIPVIPIEQIVDVNEPTVQYDNTCSPFHEVDIMITNNSVGLDQEFSVYIMPENPEEIAFPLYANNHVEVTSMSSAVVSFAANLDDNVDLNLLVYLNPMDADSPVLDVSIDACPWIVIWPPIDENEPGEELEVIEDNEIIDDEEGPGIIIDEGNDDEDGEDTPVVVEGNDDEDGEDTPAVVEGNDDEDGEDTPVVVEGNDDEDGEDTPAVVEGNDDEDGEDTPVVVEGNVWENTTNDSSVNNNEGNTPVIEEIGKPAKPEINPEDPKDIGDSDEAASSEGKETQGSSGMSLLWIILIIVAGLTTVGTATRKLQKNNS